MREELHRWLDGELEDHELPAELREDAERWRTLLAARREPGPPPPWLEQRVMSDLPARRPGWVGRVLEWIARPRTFEVRPLTAASVAAVALAALILWPGTPGTPGVAPDAGLDTALEDGARSAVQTVSHAASGEVYVQFLYVAPEAENVAVAGDFNEWSDQGFTLSDADGDGIWTGQLPLSPGLHKYMFVVDGQWVTDPQADRYVDDGFGNRNALIEVRTDGGAI